jgi:hypothetical protein
MQRGGENITPDSEELFMGLGVELKPQRRRLLRRAKRLDYLARMSSQEMLNSLAWHDELEEYGGEDTDEQQEMSETERAKRSNRRWLTVSVISVLFVILLVGSSRHKFGSR